MAGSWQPAQLEIVRDDARLGEDLARRFLRFTRNGHRLNTYSLVRT